MGFLLWNFMGCKICERIAYLISKKVVLQIELIIIWGRLELIHIIFYLVKKY